MEHGPSERIEIEKKKKPHETTGTSLKKKKGFDFGSLVVVSKTRFLNRIGIFLKIFSKGKKKLWMLITRSILIVVGYK